MSWLPIHYIHSNFEDDIDSSGVDLSHSVQLQFHLLCRLPNMNKATPGQTKGT